MYANKLINWYCQVLEVAAKYSGLTDGQQDGNFASLAVRTGL